MAGSRLLLTDRDRQVMAEVLRFGAMTRAQMQRLGLFGSATRAKERLKRLVDAKYLDVRLEPITAGGPRGVYLPGKLVTTAPSSHRISHDASGFFLLHQLALVDIRIAFEQATRLVIWRSDRELAAYKLNVVADAYLEYEHGSATVCAFVEYDRGTETLGRLEQKARHYLDLAYGGKFTKTFNRTYFRVLVVTDTAGRLSNISQTVARLTDRIFRFALLAELQRQGPLASIWRRPGTTTCESLTDS
jgi:Replication-relaxation